jgi:hypothetical protein
MYAGVPSSEPVWVSPTSELGVPVAVALPIGRVTSSAGGSEDSASRASPKSVTTIRPSRLRSTLWGLKSRWTMPAAWAAASPRPAAVNASRIAASGRRVARSHSARVSPWISSIATKSRPPAVPTSYTVTTLEWVSRAIARASRSRRSRASGVAIAPRSTLSAIRRSRSGSNAAWTTPIAPAPSSRSSR